MCKTLKFEIWYFNGSTESRWLCGTPSGSDLLLRKQMIDPSQVITLKKFYVGFVIPSFEFNVSNA
jgi:hypothetical protein